jgi:hypothetical protein
MPCVFVCAYVRDSEKGILAEYAGDITSDIILNPDSTNPTCNFENIITMICIYVVCMYAERECLSTAWEGEMD